ncbi:MAG: hypothetical protein U0572_12215 [Phycisphaerales bacterium]
MSGTNGVAAASARTDLLVVLSQELRGDATLGDADRRAALHALLAASARSEPADRSKAPPPPDAGRSPEEGMAPSP